MRRFRYCRATSLDHALTLFAEAKDPRYLSGGQTLIPTMKHGLATPSELIDIAHLPELTRISSADGVITIGAAATHAEVAGSDAVNRAIPALAGLAALIGDPAVRLLGTLGGSLANNDPAADYPAAMLALGATIHTSQKSVAADQFFTGLFSTSLEEGEIVTGVDVPIPARAAYRKIRNPASRYAMAGVFVARAPGGAIRVAVIGAGAAGVFRATAIEAALQRSWSPAALDPVVIDPRGMLSDIHGSAAYRANLVKVMAKRAAADAAPALHKGNLSAMSRP
jgi:carbon-monoxide dehydrogenase medium subunit